MSQSLFGDALDSWKELNCTTHFAQFCYAVQPKTASLAQILHFKTELVDILCEHLTITDSLALEPLLELVAVLAKDIQDDFYCFFPKISDIVIRLSDSTDTKWSFTCLASLMKTLSKKVQADIITVFTAFNGHIASPKPHIREFTAEALGFVIRKIKNPLELSLLFKHIFTTLHSSPESCEGVAICLFETTKSVNGTLHSSSSYIIPLILTAFASLSLTTQSIEYSAVEQMCTLVINHIAQPSYAQTFNIILTYTQSNTYQWSIRLLQLFCQLKKGYLIPNRKPVYALALEYLTNVTFKPETTTDDESEGLTSVNFAAALFYTSTLEFTLINGKALLDAVFNLSPTMVFHVSEQLRSKRWTHYARILVPQIIKYIYKLIFDTRYVEVSSSDVGTIAKNLAGLLDDSDTFGQIPAHHKKNGLLTLKSTVFIDALVNELQTVSLNAFGFNDPEKAATLRCYMQVLTRVSSQSEALDIILNDLIDQALNKEDISSGEMAFVGSLVACYGTRRYAQSTLSLGTSRVDDVMQLLSSLARSSEGLSGLLVYLELLKKRSVDYFSTANFLSLLNSVADSLASTNPTVRKLAVKIALLFEMELLLENTDSSLSGPVPLFAHLLDVEEIQETVDTLRAKAAALRKIQTLCLSRTLPQRYYGLIGGYLVASLSSRFTPYVNEVAAVFSAVCQDHVKMWPTFWQTLTIQRDLAYACDVESNEPLSLVAEECDPSLFYTNLLRSIAKLAPQEYHIRDIPPLFLSAYEAYTTKSTHRKLSRSELVDLLAVVSLLPRLAKCSVASDIYAATKKLIGNTDLALQKPALKCLLRFHTLPLTHTKALESLLGEETFRDALSTLSLADLVAVLSVEEGVFLVEAVARVLYAKVVSGKDKSSKNGGRARRQAVFAAIACWSDSDIAVFVGLMHEGLKTQEVPLVRVRLGYLNVVEDFVRQLKTRAEPFIGEIIETLLRIHQMDDAQGDLKKEIRQHILKRLNELFKLQTDFDFSPFAARIFNELVEPKLINFAEENSQAVSAMLDLMHTWSSRRDCLAYFLQLNTFDCVLGLLGARKVTKEVVGVVVEIVERVIEFAKEDGMEVDFDVTRDLLLPNIPALLTNLASVFANPLFSESSALATHLSRSIKIISHVAPLVQDPQTTLDIMQMLLPFLKKSANVAPEPIKMHVLVIYAAFIPTLSKEESCYETYFFKVLASLFATLRTIPARKQLAATVAAFSLVAPEFKEVSDALTDLNTYTQRTLDTRDFGKMFDGFNHITATLMLKLDALAILPVLHSMLFSMLDETEYSVRTSAAHALKIFATRAATDSSLTPLIDHIIFPGIKKGLRFAREASRQEFILLLGHIVTHNPTHTTFSGMQCLLAGGDVEADFFSNIYHIQSHRRSRAIRRLATLTAELAPATINHIILPILTHILFDVAVDHQLTNDAVEAVGECAAMLGWGAYYALLKRFLYGIGKEGQESREKIFIRVVVQIIDRFHFKITEDVSKEVIDDETIEEDEQEKDNSGILAAVVGKIIPELERHLSQEQDDTIHVRVPVAESIALLLRHLPPATLSLQLPKLLLKLCNLLKSRLQDTRDTTREVLVKIQLILGPRFLFFILTEMQTALTRGYQLHVLGWSANAIISGLLPVLNGRTEELDVCVDVIMKILMNDLFSEIGLERDVEGLKGKMKEIKTTKSFLTCEMLAASVSVASLGRMMLPLKEIMLESKETKITDKIDEVLRCFSVGLCKNAAIKTTELLSFIFGLLNESLPIYQLAQLPSQDAVSEYRTVRLGRPANQNTMRYFQANVHRFIEFGLNLLLQIVRLDKFDQQDDAVLGMFDSLTPVLSRLLYSKHDSIISLTVRSLTSLLRLSLPQLTKGFPLILKQSFKIISTNRMRDSPLMQNTFKFLIAVIRDKKDVVLDNKQLGSLLSILALDLEETDRHSTSFSLIKVIVQRKLVVEELYDVMDSVAGLMVTSQSAQIREITRHTFVAFLLDYPQGEARLKNQITFLLKNITYEYESGRESVQETISMCIRKFDPAVLMEYAQILFLSLVMQMVNDSSIKCRQGAADLIKSLVLTLDRVQMDAIIALLDGWYVSEQTVLHRATLQVYGILCESSKLDKQTLATLLERIDTILIGAERDLRRAGAIEETEEEIEAIFPAWQTCYYALSAVEKLLIASTPSAYSHTSIWQSLVRLIAHPHHWIRKSIIRILSSLSETLDPRTFSIANTSLSYLAVPENVVTLSQKLVAHLLRPDLCEVVADGVIKTLLLLSQHINMHESVYNALSNEDEDESQLGFLARLVKRLCVMCRKAAIYLKDVTNLMRMSVFKFYSDILLLVDESAALQMADPMIMILYITSEDETNHSSEPLKSLAIEVMDALQKKITTPAYLEIYRRIESAVAAARAARKAKRAILAIKNPEMNAKRKVGKNVKEKERKKRKVEEFKRGKARVKQPIKASS